MSQDHISSRHKHSAALIQSNPIRCDGNVCSIQCKLVIKSMHCTITKKKTQQQRVTATPFYHRQRHIASGRESEKNRANVHFINFNRVCFQPKSSTNVSNHSIEVDLFESMPNNSTLLAYAKWRLVIDKRIEYNSLNEHDANYESKSEKKTSKSIREKWHWMTWDHCCVVNAGGRPRDFRYSHTNWTRQKNCTATANVNWVFCLWLRNLQEFFWRVRCIVLSFFVGVSGRTKHRNGPWKTR